MFRFEHIEYLWLLVALVPLSAVFALFIMWRKKALEKFGTSSLVLQLAPNASKNKHILKYGLLFFAFVFIVLGFANPQIGTKTEKVKRQGVDVVIALDVSRSMLADDIKPNRLLRAKNFISNFIDELSNDRLGMIVFAGRAYLQMPLTVDYSAGRMYLKTINTDMVPTQGTAIAEAVDVAMETFVPGNDKNKALVIISDGEDNEEGAEEAIEEATKLGIKVFTVGVGTDKGGPIPVSVNGVTTDYKRDESNNIVLSKMNEDMLKKLADQGNGKYYRLGTGKEEVEDILKDLGKISKKEAEEVVFTDFDDQFVVCLLIAFVLLLIEWWISERKGIFGVTS
jgi:Ca-activated chloride channel family protein